MERASGKVRKIFVLFLGNGGLKWRDERDDWQPQSEESQNSVVVVVFGVSVFFDLEEGRSTSTFFC